MTLLIRTGTATPLFSLHTLSSSHSKSHSILSIAAYNSLTRLHNKAIGLNQKLFDEPQVQTPFKLKERRTLTVKASLDIADVGPVQEPQSESEDEEIVGIEDLYLDPKLQLKLEHKLRLKQAKKIRLRGKKLVRRRRMRKKVQRQPSKMKKNKNV